MNSRHPLNDRHRPLLDRLKKMETNVAIAMGGAMSLLWLLASHSGNSVQAQASPMPEGPASGFFAVGTIFLLIVLNALFVAAEVAIDLLRPMHVKYFKDTNPKQSERIQALIDNKAKHIAACTFGSQLSRIGMFLVALVPAFGLVPWLSGQLGREPSTTFGYGVFLGAAFLVWLPIFLLNLVLGELVPKSYAGLHPHRVASALNGFIQTFSVIFTGPAVIVTSVAGLLTARFGGKASFTMANQTEEEIKHLMESAEETGEIEDDEKELLHSVFEFTDTVAREVMTPRVDMDAASIKCDPKDVIGVIRKSGHSRIPFYEETDDQIEGIIHAKDLLMATVQNGTAVNLRALMRPALFVPENKNLHELLAEMKSGKSQMAVVQDEFGGTAGIVTIEDIVEELVGDIQDEYDVEEPEIVESPEGFLVSGKTHVDDVTELIGTELDGEEFDTIGGYVFGLFGRQPKEGESVVAADHLFTVAKSDGRRILRLKIEKLPETEEPETDE